MGTGEEKTSSKSSKPPASSTQEVVVPVSTPYSDWSNSMQAYPNPYFSSPVASPSPHPYMWGAQHHMMPPYGTPLPYPTMYHHPSGVYPHPNMPMPLASTPGNTETVKDQASNKKSRERTKRKRHVAEKSASGSGNNGVSQSDGSGTNSSSDENGTQQENGSSKKGSFDQMLADGNSQSKATTSVVEGSVPMRPIAQGANLNMGMQLWSPSAGTAATTRPNTSIAVVPGQEQWMDDREIKRQKRKQSNRESAKRSRLRKQAECEQLQERVEGLTNENQELREELKKLSEEYEKLKEENSSIKDQLVKACGSKAVVLVDNIEQSTVESKE